MIQNTSDSAAAKTGHRALFALKQTGTILSRGQSQAQNTDMSSFLGSDFVSLAVNAGVAGYFKPDGTPKTSDAASGPLSLLIDKQTYTKMADDLTAWVKKNVGPEAKPQYADVLYTLGGRPKAAAPSQNGSQSEVTQPIPPAH